MNSIANNHQIINVIPTRLAADHYQTPSFTNPEKIYDQIYNYDLKRWLCNCGDAVKRHNPNCKHNILLKSYIHKKKQEQTQQTEQKQHSSSVELVQVLTRISNLEAESANLKETLYAQNELIEIKDQQIIILQDRLRAAEMREPVQQKQIDRQADLISSLQTSVCRLNERTINQDETIKQLLAAMAEQKRMLEDQAQMIDQLTDQLNQQARPIEQVVRVVVEAPAKSSKREADEPKAMEIKEIRDEHGKLTACKVGRFNVRVFGNSTGDCDCSIGLLGKQCPHIVAVDRHITSK